MSGTRLAGGGVWPVMNRAAAIGLAFVLAACGPQAGATPQPRPSVAADVRERGEEALDAFLAAMADPDVTYRVNGQLRVGREDADGRPDILVNSRYDVKDDDYGGQVDIHLRDPSVGGWFNVMVLDGTAQLYSSNQDRTASMDAPDSLHRPDGVQGLAADDLTLLDMTDEGLFEFAVTPWLGGDPLGQWVDLGAVPEGALPHTEPLSHDTRLFLDAAGAPQRLASSWSFVVAGDKEQEDATLVEEFVGLGLFVTLAPIGDYPVETSHDVIVGVDADHSTITEPWVDVLADGGTATASLHIVPPPGDAPMVLGIEGAIYFVRSTDTDGELILDGIVGHQGGTIDIPVGQQTLTAYYRTCDGNCALLDPAQDFCATEAEVVEGARYELTVEVHGLHRAVPATCTLEGLDS